ncbi:hypothetical protein ACOMHN_017486 [Nucella lapillus]
MSVLKSLKGTFQNVQQDIVDGFRALTSLESSPRHEKVKRLQADGRSLDCGADLLYRYQKEWSELHNYTADTAKKAEGVDSTVTDMFTRYSTCWESACQLEEAMAALPAFTSTLTDMARLMESSCHNVLMTRPVCSVWAESSCRNVLTTRPVCSVWAESSCHNVLMTRPVCSVWAESSCRNVLTTRPVCSVWAESSCHNVLMTRPVCSVWAESSCHNVLMTRPVCSVWAESSCHNVLMTRPVCSVWAELSCHNVLMTRPVCSVWAESSCHNVLMTRPVCSVWAESSYHNVLMTRPVCSVWAESSCHNVLMTRPVCSVWAESSCHNVLMTRPVCSVWAESSCHNVLMTRPVCSVWAESLQQGFQQLEVDLERLENMCEEEALHREKASHLQQLTTYTKAKNAEAFSVKAKLWNSLKERSKEAETKKSHAMKERQEAFLAAFDSDMDYYRKHGHTDKLPSVTEFPKVSSLSEISIDEDKRALDEFLSSTEGEQHGDGESESVCSLASEANFSPLAFMMPQTVKVSIMFMMPQTVKVPIVFMMPQTVKVPIVFMMPQTVKVPIVFMMPRPPQCTVVMNHHTLALLTAHSPEHLPA